MDKLHMVVMQRKNQTRYTVCSVAASCVYATIAFHYLSSILLRLASYPGHVPSCQILLGSQQLLVSYSAAVTDYSSTDSMALRLAT